MVLHLVRKAAARLATQTILVQLPPILVRIVNRNLAAGRYPTRNDENAFFSSPEKFLELAVWPARMIDEAGKVAHVTLVNLVDMICSPADHDVHAFNAASDQAHEFGNGRASIEVLWLSTIKQWIVGSIPGGDMKEDVHSGQSRRYSCHLRCGTIARGPDIVVHRITWGSKRNSSV